MKAADRESRTEAGSGEVEGWYLDHIRPFLMREEKGRLAEFDADLDRLREVIKGLETELAVCLLGVAGVGKSTLINAIVAGHEMILPSGGIGPLTAQALTVRRGEEPGFEVFYHSTKQLWKVIFALERSLEAGRVGPTSGTATGPETGAEVPDLDAGDKDEIEALVNDEAESSKGKLAEHIKQAQLMVTGDQDGQPDLAYLADSLREATGKPRKFGTEGRADDEGRIRKLQVALELAQSGRPYSRAGEAGDIDFRSDLANHAAGFLAPLIRKLDVTWEGGVLDEDIVLVDLPGVGIANDIYRSVTHEWIREKARAVLLVVANRGITDSDAQLLQASGYLNRLLFSYENPSDDPVSLMVAVVRLDDVAATHWAMEKSMGRPPRKKLECFAETCEKSEQKVRNDLRQVLAKAWASADLGEGQSRVVDRLVEDLEVHALSAVEYRKCLVGDDDDRSFLADPEQSNVPRLRARLLRQARVRREFEAARVAEERSNFASKLLTTLDLIRAQWHEENRASQEAERLREEFLVFLEPLRAEFAQRKGAFRNFLRATLPEVIEKLVAKAREEARKEISAYLAGLGVAHFKTLQAAVRRGGIYFGARQIELPKDFALRFEVPIAEVWGKEILRRIRFETKQYAEACVQLLDDVVAWAEAQGARFQTRVVEAQRDVIKADVKSLESVGRAMVNELREQVNHRLVKGLEGPIRARCQKFVAANREVGVGAKHRMLELFHELADHATKEASVAAVEILLDCFREVEQQILTVFAQHQDPLESAKEAIVSSHEQWKKRSDAQRKKRILEEVEAIIGAAPASPGGDPAGLPEVAA